MQDNHPFRRGYLLGTEEAPALPASYRRVSPDIFLYVDGPTRHVSATSGEASVHVIGDPVDPEYPLASLAQIAADLAAGLARSDDSFMALSYRLVGRFVLVYRRGATSPRIQTDVSGMYSIFHGQQGGRRFVGSHAGLVAMQIGAPEVPPPPRRKWGTEGNRTRHKGVHLHSPSLELAIDDGTTTRIFPRAVPVPGTIDDCAALLLERTTAALRGLMARRDVVISLTAGGDTRATLAAVRHVRANPVFFTYTGGTPRPAIDLAVAGALATKFGLRYVTINRVPREAVPEALDQDLREATSIPHGRGITVAYINSFGVDRVTHIRSNVIEFFRASAIDKACERLGIVPDRPETAAQLYLACFMDKWGPNATARTVEAFRAQFDEGRWSEALTYMDARDLYFIEHRMANWHGNLVLESDYSFETFILFNSREMFDAALRIPKDVRAEGRLIHRYYEMAAPEVLKLPINPQKFP